MGSISVCSNRSFDLPLFVSRGSPLSDVTTLQMKKLKVKEKLSDSNCTCRKCHSWVWNAGLQPLSRGIPSVARAWLPDLVGLCTWVGSYGWWSGRWSRGPLVSSLRRTWQLTLCLSLVSTGRNVLGTRLASAKLEIKLLAEASERQKVHKHVPLILLTLGRNGLALGQPGPGQDPGHRLDQESQLCAGRGPGPKPYAPGKLPGLVMSYFTDLIFFPLHSSIIHRFWQQMQEP